MSEYSKELKQAVISCCLDEALDNQKSIPCEVGYERTTYPLDEAKYIDDDYLGEDHFLLRFAEIAEIIEEVYGYEKWSDKIDITEKLGRSKSDRLLKELTRDLEKIWGKGWAKSYD